MTYEINNKKLFTYMVSIFFMFLIFSTILTQNGYSKVYPKELKSKCKFDYGEQRAPNDCFINNIARLDVCRNAHFAFNTSAINTPLDSNVNFHDSNFTTTWKSQVQPITMSKENYDNVGEPSFASNGSYVFYTGNHYAAK